MTRPLVLLMAGAMLFPLRALCGDGTGSPLRKDAPPLRFTGYSRIDLLGQTRLLTSPDLQEQTPAPAEARYQSPWLASGMSLVVPGAGEVYTGSYLKAAAFFAVEVAAWAVAYTYDKKGDRQTNLFQDYADAHWSAVRYGTYAAQLPPVAGKQYDWLIQGYSQYPPWDQINWSELNRMERDIGADPGYTYYTHVLPQRPDQQYFELIGKYPQYNQGWDDADPTANSYVYGDHNVTAHFAYYAGQRGQANTYYTTASTFVTIAVANHIVSAIDAFFTAKAHNNVHAEVGARLISNGLFTAQVPVLTLRYAL